MWTEIWENVGGTWAKQAQLGTSGTWSVSGRPSGTYRYYIKDCMQDRFGIKCVDSAPASVTVTLTDPIPASPLQVAASQSGGSVAISWSSVSGATSYNVLRWGILLTGTGATSYADTSVTAGAAYVYQVQACNANGCSASTESNRIVMDAPPPPAPSAVSASSDGRYVTLSWTPVSGAARYTVQVVGQNFPRSTAETTFVDGTVVVGATYTYLVNACTNMGICSASTVSNSVTVTPPVPATPAGLTIGASASSFVLSWSAVSGATSYTIQKTAGSVSNIAGISGTSYTDTSIVANTTYGYQVQACNAAGCSAFSGSVTKAPIPAPPSNVTASSVGGRAYVVWSAVAGATSYVFKNVINTNSQPLTLTSTDHLETAVSIGATYTYQVSACNASGCSAYVNSNAVTITAPEPATPMGLTAAVNGSSIIVSWGAVSGATSYTIQRTAGSAASNVTGISGTNYTDTGVVPNTTYDYKVQACNASGCSAFSSSVTKAPLPAAPSNVTATSVGGRAYVVWSAVPGATSYVFKNVINTNSQPVTLTSTDHIETAVSIGATYTYQVSACNASGCSAYVNSNAVTIIAPEPATPTGLTAAVNNSSIIVSWGAVSGATSYTVQRTAGSAVSNVTGISGSTYTDTGIVGNTIYSYKVQACNASGCSAFSSSVTRAPIPATPSNVTASSRSGYAYVSWSAVPGATSYVFKNVISTNTQPVNVTTTDYIETAVSVGATFTYQVSACNASGCSAYVNSNAVTILAPEPGMPAGVKATANGSSIVVTWGAVNGATSYTIQKTVGGAVSNIAGVVGTSYTDAGLAPNTTYSYNVKACNSTGCSPISVGASATTPAFPAVPTGITAVVNGTSIVVSWSAVTSATSYTLRKTVGSTVSNIAGIAGVSYTETGVTPGTTYTYSVQACNAAGCSAKSIDVSVSPLSAIPGVAATQFTAGVRLFWLPVTNATFYTVKRSSDVATITLPNAVSEAAVDMSVSVDTDYVYNVQACNASGCSTGRNSAKIRIPHIPAPPVSLNALVRQNLIYLSWPNTDNATSFRLSKNGTGILTSTSPSYADAAVTKGTTYTYKVKACNQTGCSAEIATASVVAGTVQAGTNVVEGYDYNVLGRLTKVKENGAVKTQYEYDNAGNRKQVSE